MQLLLIRHSIAVDPGAFSGSDAARPLTERGRSQFGKVSRWLVESGAGPESILHSTRVRAVETAEILGAAVGLTDGQCEACPWLSSSLRVDELVASLRGNVAETVAVVGHEPDMSRVTSMLISGGSFRFQPGTVACIGFDSELINVGLGRLKWMLSPNLFGG